MKKTVYAGLVAMGLAGTGHAASFDFESGTPAEFTGTGSVVSVGGFAGLNGFAGSMWRNSGAAGQATTISLSGLATHDTVTLTFGLAMIDSWDGLNGGLSPDFFNIVADGVEVFEMSVANASGTLEQIPAGATNRSNPGNVYESFWNDSVFDVTLSFGHSGSALTLSLFSDGAGWQAGADESWGIDNLSVTTSLSTTPVPLPAGGWLLLGGLGALVLRGRRRI